MKNILLFWLVFFLGFYTQHVYSTKVWFHTISGCKFSNWGVSDSLEAQWLGMCNNDKCEGTGVLLFTYEG